MHFPRDTARVPQFSWLKKGAMHTWPVWSAQNKNLVAFLHKICSSDALAVIRVSYRIRASHPFSRQQPNEKLRLFVDDTPQ
jgi:hypothetical protein